MESSFSVSFCFRYSTICGEQPTVFSLKSSRSFPARPAVGGEYGAMRSTAWRGRGTVRTRSATGAHLYRTRVRLETLGTRQSGDCRREAFQRGWRQLLYRDDLDEIRSREPAPQPGHA